MLGFQKKKKKFAKGYTPNWLEEASVVSKIKISSLDIRD